VPWEWSVIPGHHGDIEDETTKRLGTPCHAVLSSPLNRAERRGWFEAGSMSNG
jgi:hypothetical protein